MSAEKDLQRQVFDWLEIQGAVSELSDEQRAMYEKV